MRPMLLKCPSCNGDLAVSKLHCHSCDIKVEGDFSLPALLRLNRAQLDFVEVFLKNRGIIREVERELGVSYPTVRARLDEVLDAIGFNLASTPDDNRPERAHSDDDAPAEDAATRILFLDRGRVVETAASERFFSSPETERARQFIQRYAGHAANGGR